MNPEQILELVEQSGGTLSDMKGYEQAAIGVQNNFTKPLQVVYDLTMCFFLYMQEKHSSEEEAAEYFALKVKAIIPPIFVTIMRDPMEGSMEIDDFDMDTQWCDPSIIDQDIIKLPFTSSSLSEQN